MARLTPDNVVLAQEIIDRKGITVRDGCRAEFSFDARAW